VFNAVAGTLALFVYGLFVAGLWSWLRTADTPASEPWRVLLLLGGIADRSLPPRARPHTPS
jgi:hypothetical protein